MLIDKTVKHSPTHHMTRDDVIGVIVCTLIYAMFIIYISMQLYTLIYTQDVMIYILWQRPETLV